MRDNESFELLNLFNDLLKLSWEMQRELQNKGLDSGEYGDATAHIDNEFQILIRKL